MPREAISEFQLRLRFGIRGIEACEFALTMLSRICMTGHVMFVIAFPLFITGIQVGPNTSLNLTLAQGIITSLLVIMALGMFMAALLNRPAMYFALRMLSAVEASISGKRTRQARGWMGLFFDLFPFSILVPPGDLLAIILLIMHLRMNTDHLEGKQHETFQWCEWGLILGAILQYVAIVGAVGLFMLVPSRLLPVTTGLAITLHLICLAGVFLVVQSLRRMRLELTSLMQHDRAEDTADSFFSGLTAPRRIQE